MAQVKKLWLIVPFVFGFSSAKAELLSPAEIDQSVFAKDSDFSDQFYFKGAGNKQLQAASCADFYQNTKSSGRQLNNPGTRWILIRFGNIWGPT